MELTPVVGEREPPRIAPRSGSTSCNYASELQKELSDYISKRNIIKRIGCNDYHVLDGDKLDKHVTILCTFSKELDLKTFENLYYGEHLEKTLEIYFDSVGLQYRLGVTSANKKEFSLRVFIEGKHFMPKPSGAYMSYRLIFLN